MREGKFRLIETAAERVAERLLAVFPVTRLRLELRKPIADGGYTAVITIERAANSREDLVRDQNRQIMRQASSSAHSASGMGVER